MFCPRCGHQLAGPDTGGGIVRGGPHGAADSGWFDVRLVKTYELPIEPCASVLVTPFVSGDSPCSLMVGVDEYTFDVDNDAVTFSQVQLGQPKQPAVVMTVKSRPVQVPDLDPERRLVRYAGTFYAVRNGCALTPAGWILHANVPAASVDRPCGARQWRS